MKNCIKVLLASTWMIIALILSLAIDADAYLSQYQHPSGHRPFVSRTVSISAAQKDNDNDTWMASFKARQSQINQESYWREQKWRHADCRSNTKVALPDWVRRMDVQYPLIACGSSQGDVYIAHLETGDILASTAFTTDVKSTADESSSNVMGDVERELKRLQKQALGESVSSTPKGLETTLRDLFGSFDGGGTLAIAFDDNLVAIANREGSVDILRLNEQQLIRQGTLKPLEGIIVTCLELDDDYLWVGTAGGRVQAYDLHGSLPLALQTEPELEWEFSASILSLSLSPELGYAVLTTSTGGVELINMEDDDGPIASFYPPFDSGSRRSARALALSAAIIEREVLSNEDDDDDDDDEQDADDIPLELPDLQYSIACGGNDGSIWVQPLHMTEDGEIDEDQPFSEELYQLGSHMGAVKCLVCPIPGLLVSGGLDGSMRIWDVQERESLYQFVGYKVWLGSLWTDGSRLISDGSDNSIVVHDFEKDSDAEDAEQDIL
jgi:WD40 repeat protein